MVFESPFLRQDISLARRSLQHVSDSHGFSPIDLETIGDEDCIVHLRFRLDSLSVRVLR